MSLPLWSFDSEDDSKGHVKLLDFYDGKNHYTFRDPIKAAEFLLNDAPACQIWACNMEYDINNLFPGDSHGLLCESTYLKSAFVKARLLHRRNRGRIEFFDTLRHWKIGVKAMGERLGYKKLAFDPDSVEYCRRDAEIVWKWVEAQSRAYERFGASLRSTIGSTAVRLWKKTDPPQYWLGAKERRFLADSCRGGRVEIFKAGVIHGKINVYDVNSMYPYVMSKFPFPDLSASFFTCRPNFDRFGAADVEIEYPNIYIPSLPVKTDKLVFPVGRFRGKWTYPEIRKALSDGAKIKKIHNALEFPNGVKPFNSYVGTLYDLRKNSDDDLERDTLKLLLNNLFGKFGSKNALQIWRGIKMTERPTFSREGNIIWAAYVTAYARLHLLKYLREFPFNVLYCDTDSVFILDRDLPTGKELGDLKLEGSWKTAHFILPKVYYLSRDDEKKFRAKGVPARAAEDFLTKYRASYDGPIRFRESFRRGIPANTWVEKTKRLIGKYDKRIIEKNGLTRPIILR